MDKDLTVAALEEMMHNLFSKIERPEYIYGTPEQAKALSQMHIDVCTPEWLRNLMSNN